MNAHIAAAPNAEVAIADRRVENARAAHRHAKGDEVYATYAGVLIAKADARRARVAAELELFTHGER